MQTNNISTTLQSIIDHTPEIYRQNSLFKDCVHFIKEEEWEGAVKLYIQLIEETGHDFSSQFWEKLARVSKNLGLKDLLVHCNKQLARNSEKKITIPYGWTQERTGENTSNLYIAKMLRDKWNAERREKDGLVTFINQDGIHLKIYGRTGSIYYVEEGKVAEMSWDEGEVSWNAFSGNWALPAEKEMSTEEYAKLKSTIKAWAEQKGIGFREA